MGHEERMRRFRAADLYVVITESFCAGRPSLEVLEAVLAAGVTLVQLREKDWTDRKYLAIAEAFRQRTTDAGALLIIDDRVDIALAVGADGVHLGEFDLPITAARRIAPNLIIGASSHSADEAVANQDLGASYVNIGPVFSTQTKGLPIPPLGPEAVGCIAPRLQIPFTCMGGIKHDNIEEVLSQGARHVAVVTAVTAAPDPKQAAIGLRRIINDYGEREA